MNDVMEKANHRETSFLELLWMSIGEKERDREKIFFENHI